MLPYIYKNHYNYVFTMRDVDFESRSISAFLCIFMMSTPAVIRLQSVTKHNSVLTPIRTFFILYVSELLEILI